MVNNIISIIYILIYLCLIYIVLLIKKLNQNLIYKKNLIWKIIISSNFIINLISRKIKKKNRCKQNKVIFITQRLKTIIFY